MDEHNTIPMPTEMEKKQSIAFILDAELPGGTPAERSLRQVFSELQPSVLFFGVGDCLFLAVILTVLCLVPVAFMAAEQGPLVPLLFLISPLLYGLLQTLTMWKDFMSGLLEWKQTCRIPFRTLTAVRMLLFGGISVVVCVPVNVLLWSVSGQRMDLLWMLGLSFSGLFVYAALSLACQRTQRHQALFAAPVLWILAGIVLLSWPKAAALLMTVPTAVFFLIAAGALLIQLWELRHHMLYPIEGGICYAVR